MTRVRVPARFVARNGNVELADAPQRLDVDAIHGFVAASCGSPGIPLAAVARAFAGSLDFRRDRMGARAHPERFIEVHRTDLCRGVRG